MQPVSGDAAGKKAESFDNFAANCDTWEAEARARAAEAEKQRDDFALIARYEEGQADAFKVAGMMARAVADTFIS